MATTAKKNLPISDIVDSHIPKNFKYKFIFHDDNVLTELVDSGYDMDKLDTLGNDKLVQEALRIPYTEYPRTTVAKAKEPTIFEDGVVLSKNLITKADKKLLSVGVGKFEYDETTYLAIRFKYELFDIMEIFIKT